MKITPDVLTLMLSLTFGCTARATTVEPAGLPQPFPDSPSPDAEPPAPPLPPVPPTEPPEPPERTDPCPACGMG